MRIELDFIQTRLRDNQAQMASALESLGQSVKSLKDTQTQSTHQVDRSANAFAVRRHLANDLFVRIIRENIACCAVVFQRLQQISEELSTLQNARQSLHSSQTNIVSQMQTSCSQDEESVLLLQKLPMVIIILAVLCALFKFIFPD